MYWKCAIFCDSLVKWQAGGRMPFFVYSLIIQDFYLKILWHRCRWQINEFLRKRKIEEKISFYRWKVKGLGCDGKEASNLGCSQIIVNGWKLFAITFKFIMGREGIVNSFCIYSCRNIIKMTNPNRFKDYFSLTRLLVR